MNISSSKVQAPGSFLSATPRKTTTTLSPLKPAEGLFSKVASSFKSYTPGSMNYDSKGYRPGDSAYQGGSPGLLGTPKPEVGLINSLAPKTANAQTTPRAATPTLPTTPQTSGGSTPSAYSNPFMAGGNPNSNQSAPPNNNTPVNIDYSNPVYAPGQSPFQRSVGGLLGIGGGNGAGNPSLYQSFLNRQANLQPAQGATEGLLNIARQGSPQVQQMTQNIRGLQQAQTDIATNPNVAAEVASGRGQALTGQIGAAQNALSNTLAGQAQQITAGQAGGNLALLGQAQQADIANTSANLGLTQQGQQIGALGSAAGSAAPQGYSPTTTPFNPVEGSFTGSQGDRAFSGGQAGANVALGDAFQNNRATLGALTGSSEGEGQSGMIGDFKTTLDQSGLNKNDANIANSFFQAYSTNTSGKYPQLQNQFNNIIAQYAKILGPQTINSLVTSSNGTTLSNFFASLNNAAKYVQSGNKSAASGGGVASGGGLTWDTL